MANQSSTNLKSMTTKVIAAGMKTPPHPSIIAIALFLFVGAAYAQNGPCPNGQPCVLVSDITTGQVEIWADVADGTTPINANFLSGCTGNRRASDSLHESLGEQTRV